MTKLIIVKLNWKLIKTAQALPIELKSYITPGCRVEKVSRKKRISAGKTDIYITSPGGKLLGSKSLIWVYFTEKITILCWCFYFLLWWYKHEVKSINESKFSSHEQGSQETGSAVIQTDVGIHYYWHL